MPKQCTHCSGQQGDGENKGDCPLLIAAYVLAGLAMMLNIRLSYSSAPYALIRFQLPENLFSVFVRRMASSLELWCLPSMALGNIWDVYYKKIIYVGTGGDFNPPKPEDRTSKFKWIIVPSIISQWLNFLTYVILLVVYLMGGDYGHLTTFYFVIAISGFVFGINMVLLYSVDFYYIPVYIVGENSFPALTSFIHYVSTLIFGNRRKWNSDFLLVGIDIVVAIIISFVAAMVWSIGYGHFAGNNISTGDLKHVHAFGFSGSLNPEATSPFLMIVVGMGLVYSIYPGIAPGMIVPFYLIDKIEMVLLIATIFPPVIVAALRRSFSTWGDIRSPMCKWASDSLGQGSGIFWHAFDLLMVIKIFLAAIFIYCLHYRESAISHSIINQPKMSTFLSIIFYMCHECLLALGFPGMVGANLGGDLVLIPQYIGALFMIFLAFYSEGYLIEYKIHYLHH
ncbi:Tpr-related protein family member, putative [Theileria annulata]|uniref:Tpr-related protein family member, putative n=1 Tax=Theileria annulata TaxID=5874 RepID=Q4UC60_THEAN|nr:Tpr-related protein family member, putative [Theileria annulata]CAI75591.1 Tpr-related protein family member, putative [Theileria annulata]|eukprot:XP_955067.1 Tpr-related protein family member, putative [Theileria annulata]